MPQDPFRDAFGPLEPLLGRLFENLGDPDGPFGGGPDTGPDTDRDRRPPGSRGTRGLDRFGRDLTADAAAGRLDPVIGRDDEIDAACEVLGRRPHRRRPPRPGRAGGAAGPGRAHGRGDRHRRGRRLRVRRGARG